MNKLKKHAIKREVKHYCNVKYYTRKEATPIADTAMIKYLLDSIAWLDSMEDN